MAARLHELLAVRGDLKNQADAARGDLANTFEKKRQHFSERRKTFKSVKEGEPDVVEEQLELTTTVPRELGWIGPIWAKAIDAAHVVEVANTLAEANVVLEDGTVLLRNVPATSLLELEKRAQEVIDFVKAIPTLDPSKNFKPAPDRGTDIYVAMPEDKPRTQKVQEPLVLAPATDKHPAQVQLVSKDVEIGRVLTQEWSGLITSADKGLLIERAESFRRAVKVARAKANETAIDTTDERNKIGAAIFGYVFHNDRKK